MARRKATCIATKQVLVSPTCPVLRMGFFEPRKYYETFVGATTWSEVFDEFRRFIAGSASGQMLGWV